MAEEIHDEAEEVKGHGWNKFRGKFSRKDGPLASLPFRKNQQPTSNDEVEDFLRPSSASPPQTRAPIAPVLAPINVKVDKPAWETRPEDLEEGRWRPTKPQRRHGLHVGFVEAPAEIIGEGGNEAEEAPSSIAQGKRHHSTSTSGERAGSATRTSENRIPRRPISRDEPAADGPFRQTPADMVNAEAALPVDSRSSDYPSLRPQLQPPRLVFQQPNAGQHQGERHGAGLEENVWATSPITPVAQKFSRSGDSPGEPARAKTFADRQSYRLQGTTQPGDVSPKRSPGARKDSRSYETSPETSPPRGLRRMRVEEGLAHRNSVIGANKAPQTSDEALPDLHADVGIDAPPPYPGTRRQASRRSRETSQQPRYTPSPEPSSSPRRYGGVAVGSVGGQYATPPRSSHGPSEKLYGPQMGEISKYSSAESYRPSTGSTGEQHASPPRSSHGPSEKLYGPQMGEVSKYSSTESHRPSTGSTGGQHASPPRSSHGQSEKIYGPWMGEVSKHSSAEEPRPSSSNTQLFNDQPTSTSYRQPTLPNLEKVSQPRPPAVGADSRDERRSRGKREPDHEADEAVAHFADSVGGAKAIFKLAAENGSPDGTLFDWIRCALWWFLKGRSGIEEFARASSARNPQVAAGSQLPDASALRQHHLNLAKAWWILNDIIPQRLNDVQTLEKRNYSTERPEDAQSTCVALHNAFRTLALSMRKREILPPPQEALIQGQNTTIWLPRPFGSYPPDWLWVLSGKIFMPANVNMDAEPLKAMPLTDSATTICYGRVFGRASIATGDDAPTHEPFDCILTAMRDKSGPDLIVSITSQALAVNVTIRAPGQYGVHWDHTRFDRDASALRVKLPQKLRLHIYLYPKDYGWLSACFDGAEKIMKILRTGSDERLLGSFKFVTFQYLDHSGTTDFPEEEMDMCHASVFETYRMPQEGRNRKVHRGYRLAVTTSGKVIHSMDVRSDDNEGPLYYKARASESSLYLQLNKKVGQRIVHVLLEDYQQRDMLRDFVTGIFTADNEIILHDLPLSSASVAPVSDAAEARRLDFKTLKVIDERDLDNPRAKFSAADTSKTLRLLMYSPLGSYVDRLNDASSEVRIRLDADWPMGIQIMRPEPREDVTGALHLAPPFMDDLNRAVDIVTTERSTTSFLMRSVSDMHILLQAITGYRVLYDGIASTFTISRRRTGLPLSKNWDAVRPRVLVVTREGTTQLLAFFNEYILADCLHFEVKRTDTFERADGRSSGYYVKMVDAKFVLPGSNKDDWLKEGAQRDAGARFTSLATTEYAAEHEDITVAFASEDERNRFAEALPAPVTVSRKFTLKRRI